TPCPAEGQLLVRHHLAIDAADVVLFAVLGAEADAILAADADIEFSVLDRPGIGTEPSHDFLGVRPGGVNRFWRGFDPPLEGETGLDEDVGCEGHDTSSSRNAARRSSRSDQKR